jgi:hypothetical protein
MHNNVSLKKIYLCNDVLEIGLCVGLFDLLVHAFASSSRDISGGASASYVVHRMPEIMLLCEAKVLFLGQGFRELL